MHVLRPPRRPADPLLTSRATVVLLAFLLSGCGESPEPPAEVRGGTGAGSELAGRWDQLDLAAVFGELEGTFVLLDPSGAEPPVHDPSRAGTPLPPASTFKVPHAIIALETGVAEGPGLRISRDPDIAPREEWWPASWDGDHTLASAFRGSVVWYYQAVARRIGEERMNRWLVRLGYGDAAMSGELDRFWLDGSLRVSALDQARFMARLAAGELEISEGTDRIVRELMLLDEGSGYRLFGKTGWAGFGDPGAPQIGWLIGWLELPDSTFSFALNLELRSPADAGARMGIAREIFQGLELMPAEG